jgi:hypothetical protein
MQSGAIYIVAFLNKLFPSGLPKKRVGFFLFSIKTGIDFF